MTNTLIIPVQLSRGWRDCNPSAMINAGIKRFTRFDLERDAALEIVTGVFENGASTMRC